MSDFSRNQKEIVPVKFLLVMALLVITVLISVFVFKILNLPLTGVAPKGDIVQEIVLKFEERDRFDVVVYDKEGKFIAESADGNSGFLGVVYNAVKRERIKKRITGDNLLKLRLYKNGRISLVDEVTGLEIFANSFGVQNLNVFGSLFENM